MVTVGRPAVRKLHLVLLALLAAALGIGAKAWHDTTADPVIRRVAVALPGFPAGAASVRAVLISDLHVAGPDMPPKRLAGIVARVNLLNPDIVLIAGDLVSDKRTATRHYSTAESVAPLGALQAPLGVFAVPGNHDHWRDIAEVTEELQKLGVVVLANRAARAGPLAIGGLDDDFTGHARPNEVQTAMQALGGGQVILSHSPDPFAELPAGTWLMLAGHTHCGQIGYPWGGSPATMSRYGDRYACGLVRERGNTLIVSAGLGTSVLPFRLFTQPDLWLLELRAK